VPHVLDVGEVWLVGIGGDKGEGQFCRSVSRVAVAACVDRLNAIGIRQPRFWARQVHNRLVQFLAHRFAPGRWGPV
jgi:hypothetical protein